jgi:hypothetical protein
MEPTQVKIEDLSDLELSKLMFIEKEKSEQSAKNFQVLLGEFNKRLEAVKKPEVVE